MWLLLLVIGRKFDGFFFTFTAFNQHKGHSVTGLWRVRFMQENGLENITLNQCTKRTKLTWRIWICHRLHLERFWTIQTTTCLSGRHEKQLSIRLFRTEQCICRSNPVFGIVPYAFELLIENIHAIFITIFSTGVKFLIRCYVHISWFKRIV